METRWFLILSSLLYFLPWLIAATKKKRKAPVIAVWNLLLGWTLVGWIVTLSWALLADPPKPGESPQIQKCQTVQLILASFIFGFWLWSVLNLPTQTPPVATQPVPRQDTPNPALSEPAKSPPVATPPSTRQLRPGEVLFERGAAVTGKTVVLVAENPKSRVGVVTTFAVWEAIMDAAAANDAYRLRQIDLMGGTYTVAPLTKALVLDNKIWDEVSKVRILEGRHKNRTGWVPHGWIGKNPRWGPDLKPKN